MKISIVLSQAPFVWGGAEYHADTLAKQLRVRGHQAEVIRIPFKWYPPQALLEHMLACRHLRLSTGDPDLVIPMKFPVYLAPCPKKKLWIVHQFRQVYDQWGTEYQAFPATPENLAIRDAIIEADTRHISEAQAVFTNSRNVANRLKRFNDIEADEVLYPPLDRTELLGEKPAEEYFFFPSRMNEAKRQHLVVEAMRFVRSNFRLVLCGKPETEEYGQRLDRIIEKWNLQDRVQKLGWVTEEDKADWMNRSLGAVFTPYDEDFGYVTLEACHASKPVITCHDSGGTRELVEDGVNGYVVAPEPEAIAEAMERLYANRPRARAMGHAGNQQLQQHNINWDYVIERLVA